MSSTLVLGILVYLGPFLILVCICMCCAVVRERRRARATNINQHNVPIPNTIVNPIEQASRENNSPPPPPPYTAEPSSNFDEPLPSYERAINRLS